jgi:hypothetical protein
MEEDERLIRTFVDIGKYRFQITDRKTVARGELVNRFFMIGGDDVLHP